MTDNQNFENMKKVLNNVNFVLNSVDGDILKTNDRDDSADMTDINASQNEVTPVHNQMLNTMVKFDEGPKLGRGMGFPDMKYLDPDVEGPPF